VFVIGYLRKLAAAKEGRRSEMNSLIFSHLISSQSSFRAFIQIGHRTVVGTGDGDRPDPD
jgi:hypothetical protein